MDECHTKDSSPTYTLFVTQGLNTNRIQDLFANIAGRGSWQYSRKAKAD
jgi:hypothetical protein